MFATDISELLNEENGFPKCVVFIDEAAYCASKAVTQYSVTVWGSGDSHVLAHASVVHLKFTVCVCVCECISCLSEPCYTLILHLGCQHFQFFITKISILSKRNTVLNSN